MCRPCCSLCVYRSRFSDQASYARGKVRAADRESVGTKASGSTIEFRFAHVDDLLVTGTKKFWSETFLPMMQQKFSISFNVLGEVGSEVNFLKRRIKLLEDGIMLTPGTQTAKVVECFGKHFGRARAQKIPCDAALQREDNSQKLNPVDAKNFRSVIGLLLYNSRDRVDIIFSVKEFASAMSSPPGLCSVQRLRKLVGDVKQTGDVGIKLPIPEQGAGKRKQGTEAYWLLETFTDDDWSTNKAHRRSTNKAHRRSTSSPSHFINGCFAFVASRSQKVISLFSAESELRSMVSGCCDRLGIFFRSCLEFMVGTSIENHQFTDNSAARQLISRQGVGRIRHLSGKLLWMQTKVLSGDVLIHQVPTWSFSDIGTKNLSRNRLLFLLCGVGAVDAETGAEVGLTEYQAVEEADTMVGALSTDDGLEMCPNEFKADERVSDTWTWVLVLALLVTWCFFAYFAWMLWNKLQPKLDGHETRV